MDKAQGELAIRLLATALRYERKTAVVLQSLIFLHTTHELSSDNLRLKDAIDSFEKYLKPHSLDLRGFFSGMLLVSLIAEVESYFVDVMKHLLLRYPKKVGSTQFKLSDILDKTPEDLVFMAAKDRLTKLMYKRPNEYMAELADVLSIDVAPIEPHWPAFVEAKARRDLGIHNNWLVNDTYTRKTTEVGLSLPSNLGPLMCPDLAYLNDDVSHCDAIVRSISEQLEAKYGHSPAKGSASNTGDA